MGGVAAEVACILFLGSIDTAINVIIKFVALASIAKVDDFYASALPADGNKIKKKTTPLQIKVHKRDWESFGSQEMMALNIFADQQTKQQMRVSGMARNFGRFIYKSLRILYGSWIFYFLPYMSLFIPYVANLART